MNTSRRDFIKQAAMLAGAGTAAGLIPESIRRALAIDPDPGSTYLDAEHVVILMQENRSFDHTFGMLRGVRGFNDPRAITLPDGNPVWAQADGEGKRYLPFRLNLKDTKSTWMGSLPHSWTDQVDARNDGRFDRWLAVKHSGNKAFKQMPLTLGFYTREDIPYYYALADAFTVCDQNFCSALTGTTPNRLHLWTGTIRAEPSPHAFAHVQNSDVDYGRWAEWPTFPERLEDLGVSWRVYQNELSLESGLSGEHEAWLANFTDNPLEWFSQYGVRYAASHRAFLERRIREIPGEVAAKEAQLASATGKDKERLGKEIAQLNKSLAAYEAEAPKFSRERFDALPERARRLHERAYCINSGDPDFRELTELTYRDGDVERRMLVPKGDPLYQFRKDVAEGKLPTVSWLIPSERFSDHPGSAWYGAWYLSEALDILTKNPAIWKKTVFILTYDENDGYFDHVPPFVAPDPSRPETGRVSKGIDAGLEFVTLEQDRSWHPTGPRHSPIGLGYRVPMVVASPWSRGGAVCSQIFDHTSVLMFLEKLLSQKTGKRVEEPNINRWRRAVCGDLTSVFRAADDTPAVLTPIERDAFVADVHKAQFKGLPSGFKALSESELAEFRGNPRASALMPRQERGRRPSCPLPYELNVSGALNAERSELVIRMEARRERFGDRAAGAAFTAYASTAAVGFVCRNFAVAPGEVLEDSWLLAEFGGGDYVVRVYGANGYFWEFIGSPADPAISLRTAPPPPHGAESADLEIIADATRATAGVKLLVRDNAYGGPERTVQVPVGAKSTVRVSTAASGRWYDVTLIDERSKFQRRFAGRLETGAWSISDPAMDFVG